MKIVIIGAGAVGYDLALKVSRREHDVVVVEQDPQLVGEAQETLDCHFVVGNGVSPDVLKEAGVENCDLFTAVTDSDEINIISCLTADTLGAKVKVARVRGKEYYRGERLLLNGIDLAINPDLEAVNTIREILFETGASEVHEFAGGLVRVLGAQVDAESFVAGKTLMDIKAQLGRRLSLVTAIVRGEETLIPRGDTVIQPDDRIYLAGERRNVGRSLFYVNASSKVLGKAMIVGANPTGLELAADLLATRVKVKLLDHDEEKCRNASEVLQKALVLHGSGTDVDLLVSEGVEDMDAFVAVCNDDETNLMSCLLARYHGAKRTICLVNDPGYAPLLPLLGIDAAVSPRLSTAARVARFVKRGAVVSAESLGYSGAEILQFKLDAGCRCVGRSLSELSMPKDAVIGAVIKHGVHVAIPSGATVLEAGDQVVVFALPAGVDAVEQFFSVE